jgi:hypothetical protein
VPSLFAAPIRLEKCDHEPAQAQEVDPTEPHHGACDPVQGLSNCANGRQSIVSLVLAPAHAKSRPLVVTNVICAPALETAQPK